MDCMHGARNLSRLYIAALYALKALVPPCAQFMTGQAMLFTLGRSDGVSQGWFSTWLRCVMFCQAMTCAVATFVPPSILMGMWLLSPKRHVEHFHRNLNLMTPVLFRLTRTLTACRMMGNDGWFAGWLKAKEQYTGKTRRDLGLDESRIIGSMAHVASVPNRTISSLEAGLAALQLKVADKPYAPQMREVTVGM